MLQQHKHCSYRKLCTSHFDKKQTTLANGCTIVSNHMLDKQTFDHLDHSAVINDSFCDTRRSHHVWMGP